MNEQLKRELQRLFDNLADAGGTLLGILLSQNIGPYRERLEAMSVDLYRICRSLNIILELHDATPEWARPIADEDLPF
jgi:hypothetical protein